MQGHKTTTAWAFLLLLVSMSAAPLSMAQDAPSRRPQIPAKPVSFGIVVRLSEDLLQPNEATVHRKDQVTEQILGVCNRGTCETQGNISLDFQPKRDGIAAQLCFDGTTKSTTLGRERRAIICSRSSSKVTVKTLITFDVTSGFQSGRSMAEVTPLTFCPTVQSEVGGLRGRLIRRIGSKRVARQKHLILAESCRLCERRITESAQREVQQQLERWNRLWKRFSDRLIAESLLDETSVIRYFSDDNHMLVAIQGPAIKPSSEEPSVLFPPRNFPPSDQGSLVEVVFYEDEIQKPVVADVLQLVERLLEDFASDAAVADKLSFDTSEGAHWVKLMVRRNE